MVVIYVLLLLLFCDLDACHDASYPYYAINFDHDTPYGGVVPVSGGDDLAWNYTPSIPNVGTGCGYDINYEDGQRVGCCNDRKGRISRSLSSMI